MKKYLMLAAMATLFILTGCDKNKKDEYKTRTVTVQLTYPEGSNYSAIEGIVVMASSADNTTPLESKTDAAGIASFELPAGVWSFSSSDRRSESGTVYLFNGVAGNVVVEAADTPLPVVIEFTQSKTSQVIIKELYVGGCPKDEGTGAFALDKYAILYNNSEYPARLSGICLAMVYPFPSSNKTNYDYVNGVLAYEKAGTSPAGQAFWSFAENDLELAPGAQVVVAFNGAIDNSATYSQSVDLSKAEYYVTYDPEITTMTTIHPVPAATIPTSHYLKMYNYGPGNTWAMSNMSPAVFIFAPTDGATAQGFLEDDTNVSYYQAKERPANARKMVPATWVLDAVELFEYGKTTNQKRLTAAVDLGAIEAIAGQGYSIYRNVDETATKAIKENEGKLVYNYAMGTQDVTGGTTDPSGIDAEASIKNGARIVYKDTNDSSKDFHLRAKASLRK